MVPLERAIVVVKSLLNRKRTRDGAAEGAARSPVELAESLRHQQRERYVEKAAEDKYVFIPV
jgi:hypothetical protein